MEISLLGVDLAKSSYQLHGVDARGVAVLRKRLTRSQFSVFISKLPRCIVAMEACSGSSFWGRRLRELGHEVRIMPAHLVKPFLKSQKNDANDAQAIVEAASRPSMRFSPIKEIWQHELQSLHRVRTRLVHNQTALTNQIRSILEEQGIVMACGHSALKKKIQETLSDPDCKISVSLRDLVQDLWSEYLALIEKIEKYDECLGRIARENESCRKLQDIPGVGPKIATAFIASVANPHAFKSGRMLSAWLGVVPRQHSSGGKTVLLGITKRGDKHLRSLIVHGARSVVLSVQRKMYAAPPQNALHNWIWKMLQRKHVNRVTVAVANKLIRIMWRILTHDEAYLPERAAA